MKIKKAILTGGGRATRLRPITNTINKHLIPLVNKPMIFHAIEKAVDAGIEEFFINTNPGETQLQEQIGNGSRWGVKITYFEQEGGPQGIAHVVNCAKGFIGNDPFMFYLSDNIILGSLKPLMKEFESEKYDCMLAFSEVTDPERFGVPVFDQNHKLIDVIEKPKDPPNNFAVTGIYLYGPNLFFDFFPRINKSARGEYEISDIHSQFIKSNKKVGWTEITGWWKDTGKPEDLIFANNLLLDEMKAEDFQINTLIENNKKSCINGKVSIGQGTVVGDNVKITGPVIIGDNCLLENCQIGPHVTIGNGSRIRSCSVTESIIFSNCLLEPETNITESIVGEQAEVVNHQRTHRMIVGNNTLIQL